MELKRDVRPLLPFIGIVVVAGAVTGWMERNFRGAEGSEYQLSILQRLLLAGRAFWFCLAKLFWPVNLTLIYPRWNVNAATWWQYLFVVGALLLVCGAWMWRPQSLTSALRSCGSWRLFFHCSDFSTFISSPSCSLLIIFNILPRSDLRARLRIATAFVRQRYLQTIGYRGEQCWHYA